MTSKNKNISLIACILIFLFTVPSCKDPELSIDFYPIDTLRLACPDTLRLRAFNYLFDLEQNKEYVIGFSIGTNDFLRAALYYELGSENFDDQGAIIPSKSIDLFNLGFRENEVARQNFIPYFDSVVVLDQRMFSVKKNKQTKYYTRNYILSAKPINGTTVVDTLFHLDEDTGFDLVSTDEQPLEFYNNNIFSNSFFLSSALSRNGLDKHSYLNKYYGTPSELWISLDMDKAQQINATFPLEYKDRDYNDFHPSRCINARGKFVYSFAANNDIYVYNENFKYVKSVSAKSKYIEYFRTTEDHPYNQFTSRQAYYVYEPRYLKILFDRFNQMHYRICHHRLDPDDEPKKREFSIRDKDWSIMIFDGDLNFFEEVFIDRKEGLLSNSFIMPTRNGLMVRTASVHEYEFRMFGIDREENNHYNTQQLNSYLDSCFGKHIGGDPHYYVLFMKNGCRHCGEKSARDLGNLLEHNKQLQQKITVITCTETAYANAYLPQPENKSSEMYLMERGRSLSDFKFQPSAQWDAVVIYTNDSVVQKFYNTDVFFDFKISPYLK